MLCGPPRGVAQRYLTHKVDERLIAECNERIRHASERFEVPLLYLVMPRTE
jgi:hypothetical protein